MGFLEKLRSVFVEFGVNGPLYLVSRALEGTPFGVHAYYLIAQPVPRKRLLAESRGRSIEVRQVERGDPALAGLPLTPEILAFRFGQGAICLGAFKGSEIIGCLWLCFGPYAEDEVRCRFVPRPGDRTSWDFDVYVMPEHRLGPTFVKLWDKANLLLRERGIDWSLSRISLLNKNSLSAHFRLGGQPIGKVVFLRAGPAQVMIASLPPYLHVSASRRTMPTLILSPPVARFTGNLP